MVNASCYQPCTPEHPRTCPAKEKERRGCECDRLPCAQVCLHATPRDREARYVWYTGSNQSTDHPNRSTQAEASQTEPGEGHYGYRSLSLRLAYSLRRFSVTLLSSVTINIAVATWNLVSYHLEYSQPVTEALLSIDGSYTIVYGYDPTLPDPWLIYDVTVPPYVNELETLDPGHGYWINVSVSGTITWYVGGAPLEQMGVLAPEVVVQPPATIYGVLAEAQPGQAVTAWVEGRLCGQTTVRAIEGQNWYMIDVESGCGAPGYAVTLRLDGELLAAGLGWDNRHVKRLDIGDRNRIYLPLVH